MAHRECYATVGFQVGSLPTSDNAYRTSRRCLWSSPSSPVRIAGTSAKRQHMHVRSPAIVRIDSGGNCGKSLPTDSSFRSIRRRADPPWGALGSPARLELGGPPDPCCSAGRRPWCVPYRATSHSPARANPRRQLLGRLLLPKRREKVKSRLDASDSRSANGNG